MLIALSYPHSNIAIPLQYARDFVFSTSLDGDEEGRIVLSPVLAKQAISFQVGDDLSIYCTKLSKTVWRGQIERIEETKDGELIIEALGFGALQREARISVVQFMTDKTKWKPVNVGFMTGSGYDSRGDLWEYEVIPVGGGLHLRIKTKRTFTISNSTLFFLAYLFEQPERYTKITTNERITILLATLTGLATGVWVAPITAIPSPNTYTLTFGTFTGLGSNGTVTATNCYGWVVGVRALGNETTEGATSVTFDVIINSSDGVGINATTLSTALITQGGCCNVYLPSQTYIQLEKPDANLRDIIEKVRGNSPVRYHRKRFFRDYQRPAIDFREDSPFTWRFPEKPRVVDISKAPSRVFAQYRGYWTTHLTTTKTIQTIESRRQLAQRVVDVGEYGEKTIAETRRDEAATAFERQIAPILIELDNSRYELMTTIGAVIPNWAADVSDYAIVPNYFREAKITSRTITRERTTYTISFDPNDFISVLR